MNFMKTQIKKIRIIIAQATKNYYEKKLENI